MVLHKLIVGDAYSSCNCYLVGSDHTREVFIIDPGAESETIIEKIMNYRLKPIAILLTHCHKDHTRALRKIREHFSIPLFYNKEEYKIFIRIRADKWLNEGDILMIDKIKFNILLINGHSPGGISIYTKDINRFRENEYDGIIFTGDSLFRRSVGNAFEDPDTMDYDLLCSNIKKKLIYNPCLTENFLILAGHMGITTIGEEKRLNPFGEKFLKSEDWIKNKYYGRKI